VRWVLNEVVDLLSSNEFATPHATLQSARMPERRRPLLVLRSLSRFVLCRALFQSRLFSPGDIGTQVAFPDVALHFVVLRARQPAVVLRCMNDIALQMASELGAAVVTADGFPFNLKDARGLDAVLPKIASVQRTKGA
jgi:hypothetical protein